MFGIANDEYRHKKRRSNLFSALWLWIWWRFNEEYSEICKRGIQVFNLIDTSILEKMQYNDIIYSICTSNVQSPAHCQDHCWRYHHPRRVRNPARREFLCKAPSNSRLQMPVFWLPAVHVSCNSWVITKVEPSMGFFTFNLWPANTPGIHFEAKHDGKSCHVESPRFYCKYHVELINVIQ